MEYEDTRTISTPEGVELQLHLGGLGSRFTAGLIDLAIKGLLVGAVTAATALLADGTAALIALAISVFFATVVYDILFEVRAAGRSPGKRALGLRVVLDDGGAVGLRASAVRNLLRLIEGLPLSYVPAIVTILLTRNNQRLGDLAAGTVVAREPSRAAPSFTPPLGAPEDLGGWDVSAVTPEELAAVRSFLDRRSDFAPAARRELARTLAERLRGHVDGAPAGIAHERFLEDLARAKASRG
jgi:uncharacterized RDD family membrane protein YckC